MSPSSSDKPLSTRTSPRKSASSDGAHTVGGLDSDHANLHPSNQDVIEGSDCVNGIAKKSVWSRPSNGVIEAEVAPVMGAESWPALSESTRTVPKLLATSDSTGIGFDGLSVSSPPVLMMSDHINKENLNNPIPNPNSYRPKNMKHSSSGGESSHIGSHANGRPNPPSFPVPSIEIQQQVSPEKPREMPNIKNNGNWEHGPRYSKSGGFSPHSYGGQDHHRPLHRKGSNGYSGGGSHSGWRRDPDRGSYSNDWSNPPLHHMTPPVPRGPYLRPPSFVRPPPLPAGAAPYIAMPPPIRPFVAPPMGFHDIPTFYYMPPPFVAAYPVTHAMPSTVLVNAEDYHRELDWNQQLVLKQIEYYFSAENLCKDQYLRMHMDDQGWVSVSLIAGFNRVKQYTNNMPNVINYILDVLRTSKTLEVQGERVRKHGDWKDWLYFPQASQVGTSSASNGDSVVNQMQSLALDEKTSFN